MIENAAVGTPADKTISQTASGTARLLSARGPSAEAVIVIKPSRGWVSLKLREIWVQGAKNGLSVDTFNVEG